MFSKLNETTMLLHYLAGCKTTKIKHKYIKVELQRTVIKKNLNSDQRGEGRKDKLHKKKQR